MSLYNFDFSMPACPFSSITEVDRPCISNFLIALPPQDTLGPLRDSLAGEGEKKEGDDAGGPGGSGPGGAGGSGGPPGAGGVSGGKYVPPSRRGGAGGDQSTARERIGESMPDR